MIYVLYHANCYDGFCAAWVARRYFMGRRQEQDDGRQMAISFLSVQYGQEPPEIEAGSEVYILDFCYKHYDLVSIYEKCSKLVIIDHHKTSVADVCKFGGADRATIVHDLNKSGGRLAWEYFFPTYNEYPPWLVLYTEDRDLWRWALSDSREINAFLRSHQPDFAIWDKWTTISPGDDDWYKMISEGVIILRFERAIVADHVKRAREIDLAGHKILAVNATILVSEIAGELAKDRPFGACWLESSDGTETWALRSTDDGVDVSEVAKKLGGGGHRNAAGFQEKP